MVTERCASSLKDRAACCLPLVENVYPLHTGDTPVAPGEWGETRLRNFLGNVGYKPTKPLTTSMGRRFPDYIVDGIAHESKAGVNVRLTDAIKKQIQKDAELIKNGKRDGAHWHFWQGADRSVLDFLTKNGIPYTVH